MLLLDAQADPPTHALTLTTRHHETPPAVFRKATAAVFKRLRRRFSWLRIEYYGRVEFTTGRHHRDGHRLMHGHFLVKGLAGEDLRLIEGLVRKTWAEALANADPKYRAWVVEVAELRTPGAAIHYLGLHHAKRAQLPPAEWRGMAGRPSKGYFREGVAKVREEARRQLEAEGLAFRTGLCGTDARLLVDVRRDEAAVLAETAKTLRAQWREEVVAVEGTPALRPAARAAFASQLRKAEAVQLHLSGMDAPGHLAQDGHKPFFGSARRSRRRDAHEQVTVHVPLKGDGLPVVPRRE